MSRLALLTALALALLSPTALAAPRERTTLATVLPQVMCVTCHIPLAVANSPQADQERAYIVTLIRRGDTLAQVKRALVAAYGSAVLALPPARGFALAVYVVPIVLLALLLAGLALLLPRWRRRSTSPAQAPPSPISKLESARLDADLARFDP
jgi:cytochrome c-type biogenesis protein CcmH/NrfF